MRKDVDLKTTLSVYTFFLFEKKEKKISSKNM